MKGRSRKTRIETAWVRNQNKIVWNVWKVDPEKQGLKQYPLLSVWPCSIVWKVDPEKQGLKPNRPESQPTTKKSLKGRSRKTRIETDFPEFDPYFCEIVWKVDPEKQGLKPSIRYKTPCIEGSSLKGRSRKTRIETQNERIH